MFPSESSGFRKPTFFWAKIWVHGFILISLLNRRVRLAAKKHDDCHQDDREETTYPGKHIRL